MDMSQHPDRNDPENLTPLEAAMLIAARFTEVLDEEFDEDDHTVILTALQLLQYSILAETWASMSAPIVPLLSSVRSWIDGASCRNDQSSSKASVGSFGGTVPSIVRKRCVRSFARTRCLRQST